MLSVRGVEKSFVVRHGTVRALAGVDLQVPDGQVTAILGSSGSGKTTLLRLIAGFERPDRGRIILGDRTIAGPRVFTRPERRGIGVVPQDGALFPHLSVGDNVAYGLGPAARGWLSPQRRRTRADRVDALLELVGLPGYQRRRVDTLSGGQQQRIALARALAPEPAVLLLDEPFSALDAALRAELGMEVRDLLNRLRVTAVLVTHDQNEALSLSSTVAVMRAGRVVQADTPAAVYGRPVDADTARFVGDAIVLDGRVVARQGDQSRVDCPLGPVLGAGEGTPVPGSRCQVVIRPQQLALAGEGTPAQVVTTEYFGHELMMRLRLGSTGGGPEVRVRTAAALEAAGSVHVRVSGPVHLLPAT